MPKSNPERLMRLWNADPRCHWCHRVTLSPPWSGGKLPKLAATIDHIITRRIGRGHRGRGVLACWGCNQQRNLDEAVMLHPRPRGKKRAETMRLIALGS